MKGRSIAIWLGILLLFGMLLFRLEQGQQAEGKRQLEDALRRAAVSCYALEGFYPPDVEYIRSNYAIRYEQDRYAVYYEYTASNLMPEITVVER